MEAWELAGCSGLESLEDVKLNDGFADDPLEDLVEEATGKLDDNSLDLRTENELIDDAEIAKDVDSFKDGSVDKFNELDSREDPSSEEIALDCVAEELSVAPDSLDDSFRPDDNLDD